MVHQLETNLLTINSTQIWLTLVHQTNQKPLSQLPTLLHLPQMPKKLLSLILQLLQLLQLLALLSLNNLKLILNLILNYPKLSQLSSKRTEIKERVILLKLTSTNGFGIKLIQLLVHFQELKLTPPQRLTNIGRGQLKLKQLQHKHQPQPQVQASLKNSSDYLKLEEISMLIPITVLNSGTIQTMLTCMIVRLSTPPNQEASNHLNSSLYKGKIQE
jgi:hypothetical protein